MENSNLLAVTPSQFPLESPCGFILRLTEANLYKSPHYIAKLANIYHRDLSRQGINMRKIAEILGRSHETLHGYADFTTGELVLCGHPMSLNRFNLNQRICVACIQERGYRPAWMDLRVVDACPLHRICLQTACRACQGPITWARPGLLRCSCGADLSKTAVGVSTGLAEAHIALLDATVREFEGEFGALATATLGAEFSDLGLSDWLSIFDAVSFLHRRVSRDSCGTEVTTLRRASTILTNWSVQMSEVMRRLIPGIEPGAGISEVFKEILGVRRDWAATLSADVFRRLVRKSEALPTPLSTRPAALELEKWNHVEEMPREQKRQRTHFPVQTRRLAGKAAGLPTPVLDYLIAKNLFKTASKKGRTVATANDAKDFHENLLKLAIKLPQQDSKEYVPFLESVRTRKFGTTEAKGKFVAAVLQRSIPLFHGSTATVDDFLVARATLDEFIAETQSTRFGGAMLIHEVAKRLAVNSHTVYGLVADGELNKISYSAQIRVTPESLRRFEEKYVSINSAHSSQNTTCRGRIRIARAHGVELFRWSSAQSGVPGIYFIKRSQQALFDTAMEVEWCLSINKSTININYFQDPLNPQNFWRGVGAKPNWLKAYLTAGRSLSDFLVATMPARPSRDED